MARLLFRLLAFALLQAGIGWWVFAPALAQPRPGYLAALDDKLALLKADGAPRVVFVGGSSVAFGIDSGMFERDLGLPAINLGLHAAMGLDFYLRMVEQHSRPGDLIVLLPEYVLLSDRHQMSTQDIRRLLRNCPAAGRYLGGNLPGVKQFLDTMALSELAYWTQKGTRIQRARLKRSAANRRRKAPESVRRLPPPSQTVRQTSHPSIYRRASFNRHGDMVGHHGLIPPEDREHNGDVPFDASRLADSIRRLNRCAATCRRHGAEVVFSYPPILDTTLDSSREPLQRMQAALKRSLQMPIVNQPQDTAFPKSQFFDTDLHLVGSAQQQRSQILLRGISLELAARRPASPHRWR